MSRLNVHIHLIASRVIGVSSVRLTMKGMVDRAGFEPAYGKPGQIYSLLPLTTRPPVREVPGILACLGGRP